MFSPVPAFLSRDQKTVPLWPYAAAFPTMTQSSPRTANLFTKNLQGLMFLRVSLLCELPPPLRYDLDYLTTDCR